MRDLATTPLLAGPTLLAGENPSWVESCLSALDKLPADHAAAMRASAMSAEHAALDNDDDFWPSADSWLSSYRPYVVKDGILQIPVKGVLVNNMPYALGDWATGYPYIRRALARGLADGNVRGIALVCNTPGGDVSGNFDLVDIIYDARGQKPIRAFATDFAYSAGYSIASAAAKITMVRTGGVGSIGVVTWHADYSKMLSDNGIKMTPIFAGAHKVDGNPYEALPAAVKDRIQERINSIYAIFVTAVARNRGLSEDAVRETEALTFGAEEAVKLGLADAVGSFDDAVAAFASELSDQTGGYTMSTNTDENAAAVSAAAEAAKTEGLKEGASAERARIKGIICSDQAKTRVAASVNIALNTDLNVEQALSLLDNLPADKADEPAPAPAATAKTPFETAMEQDNPNLGTGAASGGDGKEKSAADQIMADFAAAGGITVK